MHEIRVIIFAARWSQRTAHPLLYECLEHTNGKRETVY